ncbi:type II toxin-antitoxin system VapC family toxin [Aeromicrobium sp. CFBP 8757]|uniref:type II toxin-antitoxin system VapC family toxin n=1 Tax=Aeromicrobium sp. CFBP 8757 TaxID=2775288 RepID=UPI00177E4E48|nr:type II toxin-antitoxin system VapC family toxin [Aeromicrobium sp. CFBP 8757]
MIVLDTNVISEALRRDPDAVVLDWLNRQVASTLHVSTVTVAELLLGVELLDPGRRKDALRAAVSEAIGLFDGRVLPFDGPAAAVFAERMAVARSQGRAVSLADGQIAATAMSRGFEVATRDTGPFVAVGADVVDPWTVD